MLHKLRRNHDAIVVFAPHFAEYSLRLSIALSARYTVLLIMNRANFSQECAGFFSDAILDPVTILFYDAPGPGFLLRNWLKLRAFLHRPAVVHVQEQGDDFTLNFVRFMKMRFPLVLTVHDPVPHTGEDSVYANLVRANIQELRSSAHGFHVHGSYCERALRASREVCVPVIKTAHGVIFVPAADQIATPKPRTLLFFGRVQAYKGLDILIDAIQLLNEEKFEIYLTIAGTGPELSSLKHRISSISNITLKDKYVPPNEAIQLFQNSSVVIVPYKNATQSGIVAAAFGNERAVIASSVGGLVDYVRHGDNGLLVAPGDPGALSAAIKAVYAGEHTLQNLNKGAAKTAKSEFNWSNIASELNIFYRSVHADFQTHYRKKRQ